MQMIIQGLAEIAQVKRVELREKRAEDKTLKNPNILEQASVEGHKERWQRR